MSNFKTLTYNPWTGELEMADWIDDYFGQHNYGVVFQNGDVADPRKDPVREATKEEKRVFEDK